MRRKQPLTLKQFISNEVERIGVDKFKSQFAVTESTINHWRRGACLPRSEHMQLIVLLSKGRVSYKHMIETYNKAQAFKSVSKSK